MLDENRPSKIKKTLWSRLSKPKKVDERAKDNSKSGSMESIASKVPQQQ